MIWSRGHSSTGGGTKDKKQTYQGDEKKKTEEETMDARELQQHNKKVYDIIFKEGKAWKKNKKSEQEHAGWKQKNGTSWCVLCKKYETTNHQKEKDNPRTIFQTENEVWMGKRGQEELH